MTKVKLMGIVIEEMDRKFTCTECIFLEALEVLSFKCKKAMLADLCSLRPRHSKSPKNIEFSLGSRMINVIDIEFHLEVFKIHYT